jgi:hypothetical protein
MDHLVVVKLNWFMQLREYFILLINNNQSKMLIDYFFKELELNLLKVTSTESVSGVSGESESYIRDLFDKAIVYLNSQVHKLET